MEIISILFLQYGLGVVFIITGILILKSEDKWTHMLPVFMRKLMPESFLRLLMVGTAFYDLANGAWLLSGFLLGWAALLASLHLVLVLAASARTEFHEVYRDIGLLAAALALVAHFFL